MTISYPHCPTSIRSSPVTPPGTANITDPTIIGDDHAIYLFYIGSNRKVFQKGMQIGDFLSNIGTASTEGNIVAFDEDVM
jgi:hypothetical protein